MTAPQYGPYLPAKMPEKSHIHDLLAEQFGKDETFARTYLERRFRIQEVAAVLEITVDVALERLRSPDVQAHLDRLASTGEAASPVVGAREIVESLSTIVRRNTKTYLKELDEAGIERTPSAITDNDKVRLAAAKQLFDMASGPRRKELARRMAAKKAATAAVRQAIREGHADISGLKG